MTGSVIEVVAVGNELLSGDILDTNFRAIALEMKEVGGEVTRHVTVADDRATIAAQVRESLSRADLVIVTGGLGPTADDLTRFGVADALGVGLVKDAAAMATLRERFRRFGVAEMPATNEVQALFPEGSRILENPNGTAAGFLAETARGNRAIIVLPGPPRELVPMLATHVVPYLISRRTLPVLCVRRLRTIGIGESSLAEKIAAWAFGLENVEIGYYPQDPGVDLKVTSRGPERSRVEETAERAVQKLKKILGDHVFAEGRTPLPEVVGNLLRARQATLAIAESCTGGLAGSLITSIAGSSDYFDAAVVTYSNAAKIALLGIPEGLIASKGAVSEEVARAMAEAMRDRRGTDYALGITGIAGPAGGSEEKPVGLVWIALAGPAGTEARKTHHGGDRVTIQKRAAMTALDMLRREMIRS